MIFEKKKFMDSDSSSSAGVRTRKTSARKAASNPAASTQTGTRRGKKAVTDECVTPAAVESAIDVVSSDVGLVDVDTVGSQGGADMSDANQNSRNQDQNNDQDYSDDVAAHEHAEQGDYYGEHYDEGSDFYGTSDASVGQNQIVVTLSYSLMNQVRQTARMEGVLPEDIIVELVAEGVTRRAFEDAQRPAPSHLMTRTGYVAPDANGNVLQPQLSHHGMQGNNRQNQNGRFNQNNNRGHHNQGRNRQNNHFKNKQRNGK